MARLSRRNFLLYSSAAAVASPLLKACAPDLTGPSSVAGLTLPISAESPETEIKVGLLHSLSGNLAVSEAPLVDAERLAIEEINAAGGLLGKPLLPIMEDGGSDWPTFAEKAEKLINQHNVSVIFGGYTSASRKAILPVVKANQTLLWFPAAYEGQECAENIFYAGATANQQIEPAISWMLGNRGKSFFLVSSNERTTHAIAKALLKEKSGKIAGEAFVPLNTRGRADFSQIVADIQQALPDGGVIFNSLIGADNRAFFAALRQAGLPDYEYIVMSVRLTEPDIAYVGSHLTDGHYAAWPYFQTLETPENQAWLENFQSVYGQERVVGAPMVAAYSMVHLWSQAVAKAETTKTAAVRAATYGQRFDSPQGPMVVQTNHHVRQAMHIGRVRSDGQFELMWQTPNPLDPQPWSQQLPESKGFACDWSDIQKGGKYQAATAVEPPPETVTEISPLVVAEKAISA